MLLSLFVILIFIMCKIIDCHYLIIIRVLNNIQEFAAIIIINNKHRLQLKLVDNEINMAFLWHSLWDQLISLSSNHECLLAHLLEAAIIPLSSTFLFFIFHVLPLHHILLFSMNQAI